MGRVIIDMSPSIDGYVAGAGVSVDKPFGDAGDWHDVEGAAQAPADKDAAARMFANTGAFLLGRRMFDVGIGPWGDDGAFGMPCFVITSRAREKLVKGPTTFNFVTDGLDEAMRLAKETAGDKDVIVPGGADIARQTLAAGYVDEIRLHIAPVILGRGTALFAGETPRYKLDATDVATTPRATHLTLTVIR